MTRIIDQSAYGNRDTNRSGVGGWRDKHVNFGDNVAAQDARFVQNFGQFSVANPHPGFGKDPNIINELGHTAYPKWVRATNSERVIVNSPSEEAEVTGSTGTELPKKPAVKEGNDW